MAGLSEEKIERSWDPAVQADPVNRTCFSSSTVHVLTVYSSGLHSRCVHDSRLQESRTGILLHGYDSESLKNKTKNKNMYSARTIYATKDETVLSRES